MSKSDAVVLYAGQDHLNSIKDLAELIANRYPSISVILIGCGAAVAEVGSAVKYVGLPKPEFPPGLSLNPVELFFEVPRLSNAILKRELEGIAEKSRIRAFVMDLFCSAAFEVSRELKLPSYFIQTTGISGLANALYWPTIHDTIAVNMAEFNDVVSVPGCSPIHSSELPEIMRFRESKVYHHFIEMAKILRKSDGIIVFSFPALEFRALEAIQNGLCVPEGPTPPVYPIVPIINSNGGAVNVKHECLQWLDSQPSRSVIFLCFGRRGVFSGRQLREIATGLEKSGHRFLWAVRNPPELGAGEPDLEKLLPEGFLQRTASRGLVLKSWAPQTAVLAHSSIGGFVSHCGHNSILEAVSNAVPIIGLPLYAEQRMNRVLLVAELRLALPLEEDAEGIITAGEIERRVKELMESKSGKEIRIRAAEMKVSLAAALKSGGSSIVALDKFITTITSN